MYKENNNDILKFLENLSNQEVSTPIELVNKMLDILPVEIWKNEKIKFIDPCSKNGEFLREITKRLFKGLSIKIPDPQERINHILLRQIFGISVSYLTHQITKRTLYCSLEANSKYSYAREIFDDKDGNIFFDENLDHEYIKGKCKICGASKKLFSSNEKEKYAYWFIHGHKKNINDRLKEEFNEMKFDVIIGNPPYQMTDGGGGMGSSAQPIYNKFIETAIKLEPRYMVMIVPSRWFRGGKGLEKFRKDTIVDTRYKEIHHFKNAKDCFPSVQIKGGVNYFLWDKNYSGKCMFNIYENKQLVSSVSKYLNEDGDLILTDPIGVSIIKKINEFNEPKFSEIVLSSNIFSIRPNDQNLLTKKTEESTIKTISLAKGKTKYNTYYYSEELQKKKFEKINDKKRMQMINVFNSYKILTPKANGNETYKPNSFIVGPGTYVTETFLVINPSNDLQELENIIHYMKTNFFVFLVNQIKISHNTSRSTYSAIPLLNFDKIWTDEMLYEKYKLSKEEISHIENQTKYFKLNLGDNNE